MTQRSRIVGAAVGLLLLAVVLAGCGATPVAENWPGLTVADGSVFVITGLPQQVYILDAETGAQKATFIPSGDFSGRALYWSPVTVGGDLAFVGFAEPMAKPPIRRLYAFDPETGQEQWHIDAESLIIPAPTYADGVVYFGSSDGKVYAVNVETRSVKSGWPFQAQEAIWAPPLVAEGRVYVAAMDHQLHCLDAETGQEIWKTDVGGAMAASSILEDGILYVGAFDGKVHALDAGTGERIEGFDFQAENWIWSEALLADGQLYVTSLDAKLYALDPASGQVIAPYPYDSSQSGDAVNAIRAAPVMAGDSIVVATQTGRVVWVQDARAHRTEPNGAPEGQILTTPVVAGGTIYVAVMLPDSLVRVEALDAETGASLPGWPFTPTTGE